MFDAALEDGGRVDGFGAPGQRGEAKGGGGGLQAVAGKVDVPWQDDGVVRDAGVGESRAGDVRFPDGGGEGLKAFGFAAQRGGEFGERRAASPQAMPLTGSGISCSQRLRR